MPGRARRAQAEHYQACRFPQERESDQRALPGSRTASLLQKIPMAHVAAKLAELVAVSSIAGVKRRGFVVRNIDDDTTTINIIIVMVMMIIIGGMMPMPQACALQGSRHAVNSAGLMA